MSTSQFATSTSSLPTWLSPTRLTRSQSHTPSSEKRKQIINDRLIAEKLEKGELRKERIARKRKRERSRSVRERREEEEEEEEKEEKEENRNKERDEREAREVPSHSS